MRLKAAESHMVYRSKTSCPLNDFIVPSSVRIILVSQFVCLSVCLSTRCVQQ